MIPKGFTILEFLTYLTLFCFIALLALQWLSLSLGPLHFTHTHTNAMIQLHIARDIFARDIHNASAQKEDWLVIEPTKLIWKNKTIAIGWEFDNETLIRSEGTYTHTWHKKTQSIVARDVQGTCRVKQNNNAIVLVELFYSPIHDANAQIIAQATPRGVII